MKHHPKKKKKVRLTGIRKFKREVKEIVHACLIDIEYYIVADLVKHYKKRERK